MDFFYYFISWNDITICVSVKKKIVKMKLLADLSDRAGSASKQREDYVFKGRFKKYDR